LKFHICLMWYQFLNIFFFVFHTLFTVFNVVGWIFPKTRKLHLITMSLTAFSWFILGIWYGWGYCFCTDWHWDVREKLGYHDRSNSYIHFLILKLTGADLNENLVENITLVLFIISFALSIWLNIKDHFRKSGKCT
jgi:hypothetical protein